VSAPTEWSAGVQISGGWDHSIALSGGNVYVWGRNDGNTLGLDNREEQLVPVVLPKAAAWGRMQVEAVAAGYNFNIISLSYSNGYNYVLFAFGEAPNGQLGTLDQATFHDRPVAVDSSAFRKSFLPTSIIAGFAKSVMISSFLF